MINFHFGLPQTRNKLGGKMLVDDRSSVVLREMTPGSQPGNREGQNLKQQNCPSVSPGLAEPLLPPCCYTDFHKILFICISPI